MNEYFSREFSSVKKMPEVSKLQDTNTQDTKKMLTDLRNEIEWNLLPQLAKMHKEHERNRIPPKITSWSLFKENESGGWTVGFFADTKKKWTNGINASTNAIVEYTPQEQPSVLHSKSPDEVKKDEPKENFILGATVGIKAGNMDASVKIQKIWWDSWSVRVSREDTQKYDKLGQPIIKEAQNVSPWMKNTWNMNLWDESSWEKGSQVVASASMKIPDINTKISLSQERSFAKNGDLNDKNSIRLEKRLPNWTAIAENRSEQKADGKNIRQTWLQLKGSSELQGWTKAISYNLWYQKVARDHQDQETSSFQIDMKNRWDEKETRDHQDWEMNSANTNRENYSTQLSIWWSHSEMNNRVQVQLKQGSSVGVVGIDYENKITNSQEGNKKEYSLKAGLSEIPLSSTIKMKLEWSQIVSGWSNTEKELNVWMEQKLWNGSTTINYTNNTQTDWMKSDRIGLSFWERIGDNAYNMNLGVSQNQNLTSTNKQVDLGIAKTTPSWTAMGINVGHSSENGTSASMKISMPM